MQLTSSPELSTYSFIATKLAGYGNKDVKQIVTKKSCHRIHMALTTHHVKTFGSAFQRE